MISIIDRTSTTIFIAATIILSISCQKIQSQIDDLNSRVDALEETTASHARILESLQKNISISELVKNGDIYSFRFSDGNTARFSTASTPLISIGDNGNWLINGKDTGKEAEGRDPDEPGASPTIAVKDGHLLVNGDDIGINVTTSGKCIVSMMESDGSLTFFFNDGTSQTLTYENNKTYRFFVSCYSNGKLMNDGSKCVNYAVNTHLTDKEDFGFVFGNKWHTPNKNFDLVRVMTLRRAGEAVTTDYTYNHVGYISEWCNHDTDNIMPIIVTADNNADGDTPESKEYFTGGYHGYQNTYSVNSAQTMREISKTIFVDGKKMVIGDKLYGNTVRMKTVNQLQASNTQKADGKGREVLKQTIEVEMNGNTADILITLDALEDITIHNYPGLAMFNDMPKIRFIGSATHKGTYKPSKNEKSDKLTDAIVQTDDEHSLEVFIDKGFGIGDGRYNTEDFNAQVTAARKSYFLLISTPTPLKKGERVEFRGGYRFRAE